MKLFHPPPVLIVLLLLPNRLMTEPIQSLRVSTIPSEPFMCQDESGNFNNGIEYNLIKTIAEKEELHLSIRMYRNSNAINITQLLVKYDFVRIHVDWHKFPHFYSFDFSETDILIGGLIPNLYAMGILSISRPYYQDDLTWCVQKSKNYPMIINLLSAATPECWFLMIFGVGGISALIMYFMIQFDLNYEMRNNHNLVHMIVLVALPALIGINQRFHPKFMPLRIFYGFLILIMVFAWQSIFLLGWRFFSVPAQRPQTSTVDELIDYDFRLAGSVDAFAFISQENRVKWNFMDFNLFLWSDRRNFYTFIFSVHRITNQLIFHLLKHWQLPGTLNAQR